MNRKPQPYLECKACGYFYAETEENGQIKKIRGGDKRFITIKFNKVDIYLGGYIDPDAYACPECKTIRLP